MSLLTGGALGVFGVLALAIWYLRRDRDRYRHRVESAERRAARLARGQHAQADAAEALNDTLQRQRAESAPIDTDQRDDLEGRW